VSFTLWLLSYVFVMSAVTYVLFFWDKWCAINNKWRVRESTLLFCAFLGGALGGKAGQKLFRHKTRKEPFRSMLNRLLVWNIVLMAVLLTPVSQAWVLEKGHDLWAATVSTPAARNRPTNQTSKVIVHRGISH